MTTSRTRALEKLAMSFPEANQRAATGMQQARQAQLQETIKQAKPGAGPGFAQKLGAQQAQQDAVFAADAGYRSFQGIQR